MHISSQPLVVLCRLNLTKIAVLQIKRRVLNKVFACRLSHLFAAGLTRRVEGTKEFLSLLSRCEKAFKKVITGLLRLRSRHGTLPKAFIFLSRIHRVKSPWKTFGRVGDQSDVLLLVRMLPTAT